LRRDRNSAGLETPGITSQKAKSKPKFAEGGGKGKMFPRQAAETAAPGQSGRKATAAGSKHATGGLALPAKPGQCGT